MATSVDTSDQSFVIQVESLAPSGKQKFQAKAHKSIREATCPQMGDALVWAEASMAKAEWYRARSVETTSHVASDYSPAKCVEIKDISDVIYMKALIKFKDDDWREMFIAMPNDRRHGWLNRLQG